MSSFVAWLAKHHPDFLSPLLLNPLFPRHSWRLHRFLSFFDTHLPDQHAQRELIKYLHAAWRREGRES